MSTMSRRTFVKVATGALSVSAWGAAGAAEPLPQSSPASDSAKIFTVFFGIAPSRDDTDHGNRWTHFSHDDARRRASRWGEDGLPGVTDRECRLCLHCLEHAVRDKI
jgi:hypothetical protein